MFDFRSCGSEQQYQVDADPAGSDVVQPVRLDSRAFEGGSWCIPGISADIPLTLDSGDVSASQSGATFALQAHALGVRLPEGEFTTLHNTLQRQLDDYVRKHCSAADPTRLNLQLQLEDNEIAFVVSATHNVRTLALKPVIESLNDFADGLGWFVYFAISVAGGSRYPIYQPSDYGCLTEMLWFDPSLTDSEYAEFIRSEYRLSEEEAAMTDDEVIASHGNYRPSDLKDAFDGQLWMANVYRSPNEAANDPSLTRPKALSRASVRRLLKQDMPQDQRELIEAALHLQKIVQRKKDVFDGALVPSDLDEDEPDFAGNPYGGACILVWDDADFVHDLIQHYEEMEMNSGEGTEVHLVFKANADCDQQVKKLVKSFKDFVSWHAALAKVLNHFPES